MSQDSRCRELVSTVLPTGTGTPTTSQTVSSSSLPLTLSTPSTPSSPARLFMSRDTTMNPSLCGNVPDASFPGPPPSTTCNTPRTRLQPRRFPRSMPSAPHRAATLTVAWAGRTVSQAQNSQTWISPALVYQVLTDPVESTTRRQNTSLPIHRFQSGKEMGDLLISSEVLLARGLGEKTRKSPKFLELNFLNISLIQQMKFLKF